MNIVLALIIFSIIVFVHELGHFLLAKKNGISVSEFSIGMGPRLLTFKPKDTRYSIKLFPIGGSCMMGEDEESEDVNAFNNKPIWARISAIAAGPIFNFILAFVLALIVIGYVGYDKPYLTKVVDTMPAKEAGLETGDQILEIDGDRIHSGKEIALHFEMCPLTEDTITIKYKRDGKKYKTTLTPELTDLYLLGFDYMADDNPAALINITEDRPFAKAGLKVNDVITKINDTTIKTGIDMNQYFVSSPLTGEPLQVVYERNGVEGTTTVTPELSGSAYKMGLSYNLYREKCKNVFVLFADSWNEMTYYIELTIRSVGKLITGQLNKDQIGGPVAIVDMMGSVVENNKQDGIGYVILALANFCIMLSANLGVMNLLPIPALDGGRLVFLLIEAVRGKPIDREKEGFVHFIGFVALMVLMVFIFYNDISRLLR